MPHQALTIVTFKEEVKGDVAKTRKNGWSYDRVVQQWANTWRLANTWRQIRMQVTQEVTQPIRAHTDLAEDQSSVP